MFFMADSSVSLDLRVPSEIVCVHCQLWLAIFSTSHVLLCQQRGGGMEICRYNICKML